MFAVDYYDIFSLTGFFWACFNLTWDQETCSLLQLHVAYSLSSLALGQRATGVARGPMGEVPESLCDSMEAPANSSSLHERGLLHSRS